VTVGLRFVPALADIVPYEPGLPIELVKRRFGLENVVKLASNEYPLPPFPEVREAVIAAIDRLQRYPDGYATDLRAALAEHFGRRLEQVTVGCGTCELLYLLGNALLEKGDEVVFAEPSFTTYRDIIDLHEAKAVAIPLVDFTHDLEAMAAAVTPRTKMVLVCNPNNPTGTYVPAAGIARLVEAVPDDVLVVVDEAYNEFVTAPDSQDALELQQAHDNVIVLRTFSKIYGLCGLRVGYGLCAPELKSALDKVRQPFNVNLLAQVAAVEALKHQDQVVRRRDVNAELRAVMVERLAARGRATVPSQANFVLVDMRDLSRPQDQVCGALLSMGAIVRDGNALGCPGWTRVSVGTQDEIEFFLGKLASLEVETPGEGEGRPY
jgi:histidinol-phosphate aminotransferase